MIGEEIEPRELLLLLLEVVVQRLLALLDVHVHLVQDLLPLDGAGLQHQRVVDGLDHDVSELPVDSFEQLSLL